MPPDKQVTHIILLCRASPSQLRYFMLILEHFVHFVHVVLYLAALISSCYLLYLSVLKGLCSDGQQGLIGVLASQHELVCPISAVCLVQLDELVGHSRGQRALR